ncbi:sensor histidine kinase [Fusibacter tunisiensis]|uniref:histidine kinase n=1 Tax=Fusibacter tunisiensis TaxID=1008308 RepID=A0ABS2MTN8_9FIRM|nr:HAMP domain-containing sensor histidine kinase [Fusibacter tunisiensis]MBM7562777.1 signal transduction histidine kinase [Fusibacter tunisiensis]
MMSIRKIWLLILVSVVVFSIGINGMLMLTLTDRHFDTYLESSYETHIDQIQDYLKNTLASGTYSVDQMAMELETHLVDPISEIRLFDPDGHQLVAVSTDAHLAPRNRMMGNWGKRNSGETESYEVQLSDRTLGVFNVVTHTSVDNTFQAQAFKSSLIVNSIIAIGIALGVSVVLGIIMSKKMGRALKETAEFAQEIHVGGTKTYASSKILEVDQIRKSLEELNIRLKLKQKSRKALVDELIHQTRTPLTILKTHVEALEDGIIAPTDEEMSVFHHQIDNIGEIVSNVGHMIDADKQRLVSNPEPVVIETLLTQVVNGLKAQFRKKGIRLSIDMAVKPVLQTDPFLLGQTIYNLLVNALNYTSTGGSVCVKCYEANKTTRIDISDTGIGISKNDLPHLFEAYFRGAGGADKNGDGIGLYVVKENLEAIGADITVKSKENEGSIFTIEFH